MKKITLAKDVATDIRINITGLDLSNVVDVIFIISKYGQEDIELSYLGNDITIFSNYVIVSIPVDTLPVTGLYNIRLKIIDQYNDLRELNLRGYNLLATV